MKKFLLGCLLGLALPLSAGAQSLDAGFKLDRLVPIDQFLWTPHVEAVALLEK